MAKAVSLSPSQFSRQFKRQTGVPPYEYLLSLRLSKAKELLKTTELPVHEIACQCGFGGESSFISFLKTGGHSAFKIQNRFILIKIFFLRMIFL